MTRFSKANPCPICGGWEKMRRGFGERCYGFISDDGKWAHCTRPEFAPGIRVKRGSYTYAHAIEGECRCGKRHQGSSVPEAPMPTERQRISATYAYTGADGTLLYEVVRYHPKTFRQRRPDGNDLWIWNVHGVDRVLFRLPELLAADPNQPVFVTEGEKDADNLAQLGLVATTNSGGAGKWRPEYSEHLRGRDVVLLPDNDDAGRNHVHDVARSLFGIARSIKVLQLPGLPEKGDVSDWLDAGGTADALMQLVAATPMYRADEHEVGKHDHNIEVMRQRPATPAWPEPLADEAFHGLPGEFVRYVGPYSEADPAALLLQFLTALGNLFGPGPHWRAEADRHAVNLFIALVGVTAKSRKGTSLGQVRRHLERCDREWSERCVHTGLSSGEGLIHAVRDGTEGVDAGVTDKRLLVVETEFSSTLRVLVRDGNTLSAKLRDAWDGRTLQIMTKQAPAKATNPHISIIAHITRDELRRDLSQTDAGNGFGNRFLWVSARRSKLLPEGGSVPEATIDTLTGKLQDAVAYVRQLGDRELRRDEAAAATWRAVYPELSEGHPGLFGSVTSRAEAQVMRLACLYALLDKSPMVGQEHLLAALAVWEYCEASAQFIFGSALGDPLADELLRLIQRADGGLTRTEISTLLGRNKTAAAIGQALTLLAEHGLAYPQVEPTGGRATERWFSTSYVKANNGAAGMLPSNLISSTSFNSLRPELQR